MCAALFGLIAVCSTIALPAPRVPVAAACWRRSRRNVPPFEQEFR